MEPKLLTGLAAFTGMAIVWAFSALAWKKEAHSSGANKSQCTHVFRMRKDMRLLGMFMTFAPVILISIFAIGISPDNIKAGDWVIALFLGAFMGGIGSMTGITLWISRIYVSDNGVFGLSPLGAPRYIAWSRLSRMDFSGGMQAYKLTGDSKPVYIPYFVDDYQKFIGLVRNYTPGIEIEEGLDKSPEAMVPERYLRSMEKHSLLILSLAGICVLVSAPFLFPYFGALVFSGIGGFFLVLDLVSRRVVPNISSAARNIIHISGIIGFMSFYNISFSKYKEYLGGEEAIDGYIWSVLILQIISFSMLSSFALVVIIKHMFPVDKNA